MLRRAERKVKQAAGSFLRSVLRAGPVPAINAGTIRSILVVRQHNQLGDMLCAVPLLRALRTHVPSARITLVTSPVNHAVMLHNRFVDRTILFDKSAMMRGGIPRPGVLGAFIGSVRELRCDCAIVPSTVSTSFTSDLIARLSGAAVRLGCESLNGRANPSSFVFTHPVVLDWRSNPGCHQARRNMDVAALLLPPDADLTSEITLTEEEQEQGRREVIALREDAGCAIGFHPGAGKSANRWPAEKFARVAEVLCAEFGAAAFITCGPMDDEPVAAMERAMSIRRHVIRGRAIREVAAMLARMNLVVTNDTGIMHVAAAVGVPVLSLFGPTDPRQWAPAGPIHGYIQGEGGDIGAVAVEEVLRLARTMLGPGASRVLA